MTNLQYPKNQQKQLGCTSINIYVQYKYTYMTLHYIAVHYITLHYIKLHYITLQTYIHT